MTASNDPDPKLRLDASGSGKPVWYQDIRFISVLLLVVGLLALPLVWINKTLTLQKKDPDHGDFGSDRRGSFCGKRMAA